MIISKFLVQLFQRLAQISVLLTPLSRTSRDSVISLARLTLRFNEDVAHVVFDAADDRLSSVFRDVDVVALWALRLHVVNQAREMRLRVVANPVVVDFVGAPDPTEAGNGRGNIEAVPVLR